jgi:hypothetical protein
VFDRRTRARPLLRFGACDRRWSGHVCAAVVKGTAAHTPRVALTLRIIVPAIGLQEIDGEPVPLRAPAAHTPRVALTLRIIVPAIDS